MTTIVAAAPVIVQTCRVWPSLDAGWTTRSDLMFMGGSEPCGQKYGDAQLKNLYGVIQYPGATAATSLGPDPDTGRTYDGSVPMFPGQFVRLLIKDGAGAITVSGITYTAFWWGVFVDAEEVPDGYSLTDVGGEVDHVCLGLGFVLEQITIQRGFERSANVSAGDAFDPGYCPEFNAEIDGDMGGTITWGGKTLPLHDRYNPGSAFTALDVAHQVLYGHVRIDLGLPPNFGSVSGDNSTLVWEIGGQTTALAYTINKLDLNGETVFAAINHLINQRRGLTWNYAVSGVTVTINVRTVAVADIVIGSFTLPAATSTATLDYRGDITLDELSLQQSHQNVYDRIMVVGKRPKVTLSGEFKTSSSQTFSKGWLTSLESTWAPFGDTAKAPLEQYIWRRFALDKLWNGSQLDLEATDGLRNNRAFTSTDDADYGYGGYTGERTYLDDSMTDPYPGPSGTTIKLLRMLQMPANTDIVAFPQFDKTDVNAEPIAMLEYVSATDVIDLAGAMALRIEESPPAILLGSSGEDAEFLRAAFDAGAARLIVTFSVEEPCPLMVSWQRHPDNWPRNTPRTKTISVDNAEQWVVLNGTYIKNSALTTPKITSDIVLRDDIELLRQILALARTWYSEPFYNATWVKRGTLDFSSTYKTGTLLSNVIQGDHTTAVNGLITDRRWIRNGDSIDTHYATERILPDFDQGIV